MPKFLKIDESKLHYQLNIGNQKGFLFNRNGSIYFLRLSKAKEQRVTINTQYPSYKYSKI